MLISRQNNWNCFSVPPRKNFTNFCLTFMVTTFFLPQCTRSKKFFGALTPSKASLRTKLPSIISQKRLRIVWKGLRDRLGTVDSSTSTVEITNDYAAHFYDMYINKHDGKHMTGDPMKILLLNLPFLLRDVAPRAHLVEPEVRHVYHA